jgi:O-antigen/teichoic acid export membrane protein
LFGTIRFLLPALYGHQFDSAVSIANWLIVAFTLRALQRVLEYMVRATDTARVGTVSSTIIAVVVLALGVPLAMHHGATGFAQALCAAYFVGLVVAVFMGAASMHGRVRDFWGIRLSSVLLLVRKLAGAARVIFPGRRV